MRKEHAFCEKLNRKAHGTRTSRGCGGTKNDGVHRAVNACAGPHSVASAPLGIRADRMLVSPPFWVLLVLEGASWPCGRA